MAVTLKRFAGVTHGFFQMPAVLEASKAAIAAAADAIRRAIG